ncbi:MAG TPA: DUF3810 family protein [Vicinamibacterales bacterium]|nr:DUF3810 family protein [Vicinamibacterales bacterium]
MKRAVILGGAAVAAAVVPLPAEWVDRAYSRAIYPLLQAPITAASNAVPFALFDALVGVVFVAWVLIAVRDVRATGWTAAARSALVRTTAWSGAAYLAFLALWGLNYRRVPLDRSLPFDRRAITREHAGRVAATAMERLNALAGEAHRTGWRPAGEIDPPLRDGLSAAVRDLGIAPPRAGRPKHTLLDLYFRRAGVEGMTDPFLLETLVVSDLLPFERPFVIAHEWSHLAGLAEESAASFAGWLACVRGSVPDQYSGWLFLYDELSAALPRADRTAVASALGDTPRADLAAAHARVLANIQPNVSAVAWRAYDSYLKSNRVASGTRSYDEVVQLVLGTDFDENWHPKRR